jgi:hypothetical protein
MLLTAAQLLCSPKAAVVVGVETEARAVTVVPVDTVDEEATGMMGKTHHRDMTEVRILIELALCSVQNLILFMLFQAMVEMAGMVVRVEMEAAVLMEAAQRLAVLLAEVEMSLCPLEIQSYSC